MGKNIERVYIAGPITPHKKKDSSIEHLTNIRRGIKAGKSLIRLGFSPYNPFLDYAYWLVDDGDFFLTVKAIRNSDLKQLECQDAVLVLPGWRKSVGARGEIEHAKKKGIPIFENIDDLVEYRNKCKEDKN